MSRLASLSDIHGNLLALQAIVADLRNFEVEPIIVAGDVINFGPFSKQTVEMVYHINMHDSR